MVCLQCLKPFIDMQWSVFACLFFMMCTLHQNFPFYILIPFMYFKKCFMKVFMIFSWFENWYISPLNTWKQQDLGFACIQGGKCQTSIQEKIEENPLLVLFLFTSLYYFGKRHKMIKCTTFKYIFLKNVCNLGHYDY